MQVAQKKKWEVRHKEVTREKRREEQRATKLRIFRELYGMDRAPEGHKPCLQCKAMLPLSQFYVRKITKKNKQLHRAWCIACEQVANYEQRETSRSKEYRQNYRLVKEHGITLSEYRMMHEAQRGMCAICGKTKDDDARKFSLAVDHCHKTGKIRGLLCLHCNVGIGKFGDDHALMERAVNYLKRNLEHK